MVKTTRKFVKAKETKNTVKFEEEAPEGEAPIIGSLYVQKFFGGKADSLTITVEIDE